MQTDAREAVRIAIRRQKLKQKHVAAQAGLTAQQLNDTVKKRRRLDADELFKLCEIIGVTPNDILAIAKEAAPERGGNL